MTPLRQHVNRVRSCLLDETWAVGIANRPIASFLDLPVLSDVAWLPVPKGAYFADPFGMPDGVSLMVEHFDHRTAMGRLIRIGLDGVSRDDEPLEPRPVGHASFPYLLEADGELYCLPETAAARHLDLWRQEIDGRFRPAFRLLEDVPAADPVLFLWQGLWWLGFTDVRLGEHDNFCLYYARSLSGPWCPHKRNPVASGRHASRSAGTPFLHDACLYRPAQDCNRTYGGAVVINRIERLDPDNFVETSMVRVAPEAGGQFCHGAHTLTAWGPRTLVDAKRHGFVPTAFGRRVHKRLVRRTGTELPHKDPSP
jgi:hypothetical protein